MLKIVRTAKTYSSPEWRMDSLTALPYGVTSVCLKDSNGKDWFRLFTEDILANPSALQIGDDLLKTSEISGLLSHVSSVNVNPITVSLKMSPGIYNSAFKKSPMIWKRWITKLRQDSLRRLKLVLPTGDNGYTYSPDDTRGTMWPTPDASVSTRFNQGGSNGRVGRRRPCLAQAVKLWPTPTARDYRSGVNKTCWYNARPLSEVVGGLLNPMWVEWLMGFPSGWTDLKPLAMPLFQQWQQKHSFTCTIN